ncbi:MAG: PA domain-containing protein, partial [Pyrinomonadaceae bacterium]
MLKSLGRVVSFLFICTAIFGQSMSTGMLGFSAESARAEAALESRFDAALNPENLRNWMKRISARPHHLGSPHNKENADFIAAQFRSWGYDTKLEEFQVLFPTPKTRLVEMTAPARFKLKLQETELKEDATSGQLAEQLPSYNAYSIDGDVTAPLVYVNFGVPSDYEELDRRGIDVKGKIVIARYGGSWRGIKPKVAAEHGAVGCLIYS